MIPTLALAQFGMAGGAATAVPPIGLDLFAGGLWAQYGITKLAAAYAGSALRVRRSSDNTEQDIGFSGTALDTVALAAFAGAGSAFVTTWYDQGGYGRHLVQATSSKQPRIVNAGVYDGFLRFDGSDDFLTVAGSPVVAAISGAMKYQFRSGGAGQALWSQGNTNVAAHVAFAIQEQTGPDAMHMYQFGGIAPNYLQNRFATVPTTLGTDVWVMDRTLAGAARGARYRNGVSEAATNLVNAGSGSFTTETFFVGADSNGAAAAPLNLYTMAIWAANQSANAAGIHAAIA